MITLKEVTKQNWLEIVRHSSAEDQKNRVFERKWLWEAGFTTSYKRNDGSV
jgi:hypothetical protein